MVTMCSQSGCFDVATGVGYWQGNRTSRNPSPPRRRDLCRKHLLEQIADEFVQVEVIGEFRIVNAKDQMSYGKGNKVWLDPVETYIPALIAGGLVKALPQPVEE